MRAAIGLLVLTAACGGPDEVGGLPEARRCAIDRPAPGGLAIDGTRIVDAHGREVALRGVNAGGRSKLAPYVPFDFDEGGYQAALDAYLDRAATWGIDVLRVPFSWQAVEPEPGVLDEVFLARYDALLDGAWARGMWTIVDFHQDLYAEPLCGDGFPAWTLENPGPPQRDCEDWFQRYDTEEVQAAFDRFWAPDSPVRPAFDAMWRRMAERHRDRVGVIGYEIINEPHQGSAATATWGPTTLTSFYSELGALIAEADPDAMVFVDPTGIEGVIGRTDLARPEGDHIVLAPHYYDPSVVFGVEPDPDVTGRLAPWAAKGQEWGVPVLIGEMGIQVENEYAAVHLRHHLDALDAHGIHGTWWEYSQAELVWNFERFSIVEPDGTETPLVDELARPYARALAGAIVEVGYDAEARRYTLAYTPAGDAPSELSVPTRWDGVRIGAEGGCVAEEDGRVLVRADDGAEVVRVAIEPR